MKGRAVQLTMYAGICLFLTGASIQTRANNEADIADLLTALLKAGCAVVADHQALINDPSKGNKGFTDEFIGQAIMNKLKADAQIDLSHFSGLPYGGYLLAMLQSEREVVFDAQPAINKLGIGFKGFVPSVFVQRVGAKFHAKTGIMLKFTRVDDRFMNRKPDAFETEVLHMFADPRHPKGQRYAKATIVNGKSVLRAIYPEYADAAYSICDGDSGGERVSSGVYQGSWEPGRLACAISFVLPMQ